MLREAVNPLQNNLLDGDLCKISFISIFSFFLVLNMILSDALIFTHIPASNTASDDVTN